MSFGAIYWLFALLLIPTLIALFFSNERRRRLLIEKIVAARLQSNLAGSVSLSKRRARFFIFLAGLACVIVSLAQPRFGYTWDQSKRKGRDILIAIDTSKSMLSNDVQPDRLTRAKMAALDLIKMLQGDRVGLVAFAGSAFLQAPLTIDYGAVATSVNELDTHIIPKGGTDISAAIRCAADAFGKGESENRCLILITDGDDLGKDALETAHSQKDNFRIFTVGVGSTEGSIIPVPEEQGGTTFIKDSNGEFVKSRLDEACLQQIADATGGIYVHLGNGINPMKQIITEGLGKVQERDIDVRQSRHPIERYQWPLGLGLALLALSTIIGERKRLSKIALIALFLGLHGMAFARNPGLDLYDNQNYKDAYQLFQNQLQKNPGSQGLQFNEGASAYQMGEYDKALESFSKALTATDPALRSAVEYNLGNTLVRRGELQQNKEAKIKEWKNAIQHYEEAKDSKNAKYNLDLVKKMIEALEKEPPKQDQSKQDQSKQDQSKQDQSKQDQSKQDQSKQDQSKQDQSKQDQSKQDQSKQDQSKQDQSKQDQSKQDQSKQDQSKQDQSKQDQSKQDQSKQDQSKQDQSKQDQSKQDQSKQDPGSPKPTPEQPDKKLTGDIKEGNSDNENKQEAKEAEEVSGQPGEMTAAQARALVDSLKDEEQRVNLQEHKESVPVLKDW